MSCASSSTYFIARLFCRSYEDHHHAFSVLYFDTAGLVAGRTTDL